MARTIWRCLERSVAWPCGGACEKCGSTSGPSGHSGGIAAAVQNARPILKEVPMVPTDLSGCLQLLGSRQVAEYTVASCDEAACYMCLDHWSIVELAWAQTAKRF